MPVGCACGLPVPVSCACTCACACACASACASDSDSDCDCAVVVPYALVATKGGGGYAIGGLAVINDAEGTMNDFDIELTSISLFFSFFFARFHQRHHYSAVPRCLHHAALRGGLTRRR